jgi:uncharacterized protein (DUF2147 family)
MKKIGTFITLTIVMTVWLGLSANAQRKSDDILGIWFNEEKTSKVQIYKENNKYYAKVVWLKEPNDATTGKPRTDNLNPEAKYHNNPLMGLVIMKDFAFDGKDEWTDGTIYDPKNGKTYKGYIEFEDANKLKLRGFIGVSMLGRNTYWTKTVLPASQQ